MFDTPLKDEASALLDLCKGRGQKIATAESCTGGLVAALLTDIAGSSAVVDRGFVTYSNEAKQELLGVPADTLASYGAVSTQTAQAMAKGAVARSRAQIAVAITGVAGPGGGSAEKPVGLVHFAVANRKGMVLSREERFGEIGREAVRYKSVQTALELLADDQRPVSVAGLP